MEDQMEIKARGWMLIVAACWIALTLLWVWDFRPHGGNGGKGESIPQQPIPGYQIPGCQIPGATTTLLPACLSLLLGGVVFIRKPHRAGCWVKCLISLGVCSSAVLLLRLIISDISQVGSIFAFFVVVAAFFVPFLRISSDAMTPRTLFYFHFSLVASSLATISIWQYASDWTLVVLFPIVLVGWVGWLSGLWFGYFFPCLLFVAVKTFQQPFGRTILTLDIFLVALQTAIFFLMMYSPTPC
jgi:hypothetical protein